MRATRRERGAPRRDSAAMPPNRRPRRDAQPPYRSTIAAAPAQQRRRHVAARGLRCRRRFEAASPDFVPPRCFARFCATRRAICTRSRFLADEAARQASETEGVFEMPMICAPASGGAQSRRCRAVPKSRQRLEYARRRPRCFVDDVELRRKLDGDARRVATPLHGRGRKHDAAPLLPRAPHAPFCRRCLIRGASRANIRYAAAAGRLFCRRRTRSVLMASPAAVLRCTAFCAVPPLPSLA